MTGGNPWKGPHHPAGWFAMTCVVQQVKTPPPFGRGVDKSAQTWYFIDTGVLPVDGSPVDYKEVTETLGSWRLLLFIIIIFLANQGDNCDNDHTESK